jgi:DNA-binding MurR/RpiR family transcriptional regulator
MQSRHIYIIGVRNSAPLAQFLAFYLTPIFPCVRLIHTNSASEIYEQMLHISSKDVVIGISFPRYSMRILKALEFANSRNAKVITITDTEFSPINLYASCKLLAKSKMCSVVDTLTPAFSLVNALIVSICMKKKKKVLDSLEELNRVWDEYPVDSHDEMNPLAEDIYMEEQLDDFREEL